MRRVEPRSARGLQLGEASLRASGLVSASKMNKIEAYRLIADGYRDNERTAILCGDSYKADIYRQLAETYEAKARLIEVRNLNRIITQLTNK